LSGARAPLEFPVTDEEEILSRAFIYTRSGKLGVRRKKNALGPKKMKMVVDRKRAPAYTNVTGDAVRGAPMTFL
jgi:hypothetical protein